MKRPIVHVGLVVMFALASALAQDAPAQLRLVHALLGAGTATLHVDDAFVHEAEVGNAAAAYLPVVAGAPVVAVEVDGMRVEAPTRELRAGFRYLAVAYRSEAGAPVLEVVSGPAGRMTALGLLRTVNLVPALSKVRTYVGDACDGSSELAASFGNVFPYGEWEFTNVGRMTVCADDTPLTETRERPADAAEPWLLAGRALAIYVVAGPEGHPEVLFVDETP